MRLIFILLSFSLLQACLVPLPKPAAAPAENPGSVDAAGKALNAYRKANGLSPVYLNPALTKAARTQSADMQAMGKLVHVSKDGAGLKARARRAGYALCYGAENIAEGYSGATNVMDRWYHSPGHNKNMLNPKVTEYGYGTSGTYSTLILASKC